ncbi:MAG: M23 family metallopeptidase [Eubacteriales bacterium]|nr:M23 family metallopeptidase [Eubacteriales bacterium]
MQKEKFVRFLKSKGTLGILTLCLVGAVAFATYRSGYDERQQSLQQISKVKETEQTEEKNLEASGQDVVAEIQPVKDYTSANEKDVDPASLVNNSDPYAFDQHEEAVDVASSAATAQIQPTVDFQDDSMLVWPAAGTVLMEYNMNNTVYFKTLNQYKYNPALIISSEVGNQVLASARGIVESVSVNEETGTTLKLNLGNNYALIYGQLKEVAVSEGDVVEQGQLLGYVSEPTKYYCEEGSNLYFQMQKDGQAVDPFLYLE